MATYTPPPYFPQSSLAPPDKNRYLKFKLAMFGLAVFLLALLGGAPKPVTKSKKADPVPKAEAAVPQKPADRPN